MPRWAAKVDGNHQEIVSALRLCGWQTADTSRVGGGFPDLVIAKGGRTILVEVKMPKGKLLPVQRAWLTSWPGETAIVRSVDDVLLLNRSGQATANTYGDK